jgi:hypothetical protein
MNINTARVMTALLTLAVGGLVCLGEMHFLLAQRASVLEDTVVGLTKDQIVNMERFQALETSVFGKTAKP